jgi:hypothetical protein
MGVAVQAKIKIKFQMNTIEELVGIDKKSDSPLCFAKVEWQILLQTWSTESSRVI